MAGWTKMPLGMEVGLAQVTLCSIGTQLPQKKWHNPTQFLAHVYCGQTAGWTKVSLGMEVGLGPGDFVLDVDLVPLPKKGVAPSPIFGPCLLWPNGWTKVSLGTEVNLGPGDVVLDGVAAPPKWGTGRQFSVHVYCGQTAGAEWMKMHLVWKQTLAQATLC